MGLSYASDPAITRHLADFLNRRKPAENGKNGKNGKTKDTGSLLPTAILFNGGVMKPESSRKQVVDVISSWSDTPDAVREIETRDFDLSVARGAVYYGIARITSYNVCYTKLLRT